MMNHINDFLLLQLDLTLPKHPNTYITFLKGYDSDYPKNSKLSIYFQLEKKFSGGSLCMEGTAGIWAVHFFSSTHFVEMNIFELSMDQIFRIWSTFMNPGQFLILVTHLFTVLNESIKFHGKILKFLQICQKF
jgi:hypothetical protein